MENNCNSRDACVRTAIACGMVEKTGAQVLRAFLQQAPPYLSPRGRILFGVQTIFVPRQRVESIVEEGDFDVLRRFSRCCIPSVAYVLRKRGGQGGGGEQGREG